jgi:excinuclease UvrABC nuclease subunit
MRALRKIKLYKKDGGFNILHLKGKSGVYLIYQKNKLVYVGRSSTNRLYKTITRHFQQWNDKAQEGRISYHTDKKTDFSIKVYITKKADAYPLECSLILRYRPRDNKYKIQSCSISQTDRVSKRFKNKVASSPKDDYFDDKMSYNEKGQLVDKNGNIIF